LVVSEKEDTILEEIREKTKSKKPKRDDSFDAAKPRKAVLKAQGNSMQLGQRDSSGTPKSSSKKSKVSVNVYQ